MENIKEAIVETLEDVNEIVLETAEDVKDFAVEKMKDFKDGGDGGGGEVEAEAWNLWELLRAEQSHHRTGTILLKDFQNICTGFNILCYNVWARSRLYLADLTIIEPVEAHFGALLNLVSAVSDKFPHMSQLKTGRDAS